MSKKKRCSKGYNCGASCISIKKACRKEFPEGISVSLDKTTIFVNTLTPKEQKSVKIDYDELKSKLEGIFNNFETEDEVELDTDFRNGNKMVTISRAIESDEFYNSIEMNFRPSKDENEVEVFFTVNGNFNSTQMERKEKVEVGKLIKDTWQRSIEAFPDGTVFYQEAFNVDGNGQKRANAYKKMGFNMKETVDNLVASHEGKAVKKGSGIEPLDFVELKDVPEEVFFTAWSGEEL